MAGDDAKKVEGRGDAGETWLGRRENVHVAQVDERNGLGYHQQDPLAETF
jgi:hypothetical protein